MAHQWTAHFFLKFYRKSIAILIQLPWFRKKAVSQCRKWINPYLYTLRRTRALAFTLPNAISYLKTCTPCLNTCIIYLNTLTRLSPPYLNTCTTYPYTLSRLPAPYLNTCTAYLYTNTTRQPIRIEHPRTLGSRQPIEIEYYVTRVVSQSKSSITSPESSANQNRALCYPRALGWGWGPFSTRYSLS